jgi:hypothetical protein
MLVQGDRWRCVIVKWEWFRVSKVMDLKVITGYLEIRVLSEVGHHVETMIHLFIMQILSVPATRNLNHQGRTWQRWLVILAVMIALSNPSFQRYLKTTYS